MSDGELQRAVRDHYEGQRLPDEKIRALLDKAEAQAVDASAADAVPTRWRAWVATAAAALVVALGVAWWTTRGPSQASVQAMAKKIALGHAKDLAAEFEATDFAGLRDRMPKLDFAPAAPRQHDVPKLKLVGARYCSLHQRIAVLVKFEDAAGRRHTLYQVADADAFDYAAGTSITRDDLRIRFWREGDVFMGLASPRD